MVYLYVPDVGDGLAAGVHTLSGVDIEIDCGSQRDSTAAAEKGLGVIRPDVFVLSHPHLDHYNGLWEWLRGRRPHLAVREAYFARVPEFPDRERFVYALLTIAHRVLGDETGSIDADFLRLLSRVNSRSFTYRCLSAGDSINIEGSQFTVLWPPRVIDAAETLGVVRRAIDKFDAALAEDEATRRIHDAIGERGEVRPYVSSDQESGQLCGHARESPDAEAPPTEGQQAKLPPVVRNANAALRDAANRMSLAFHEDNRLLFMGDLEESEIQAVARQLDGNCSRRFHAMITPHHGTHWHDELRCVRCDWAVSSIGPRLLKNARPEYKSIAEITAHTHLAGDVVVHALLPPVRRHPWRYRWWPYA
jgi:beta-lactamase superfamily II metal-dependent hydrolase